MSYQSDGTLVDTRRINRQEGRLGSVGTCKNDVRNKREMSYTVPTLVCHTWEKSPRLK